MIKPYFKIIIDNKLKAREKCIRANLIIAIIEALFHQKKFSQSCCYVRAVAFVTIFVTKF